MCFCGKSDATSPREFSSSSCSKKCTVSSFREGLAERINMKREHLDLAPIGGRVAALLQRWLASAYGSGVAVFVIMGAAEKLLVSDTISGFLKRTWRTFLPDFGAGTERNKV